MSLFEGRLKEDVINFTIGAPGPDLLLRAQEVFQQSCSPLNLQLFQYGPNQGTVGNIDNFWAKNL